MWVYSQDLFKGHTLPSDKDLVPLHTHVILMRLLVSALSTVAQDPRRTTGVLPPFSHGDRDFPGAQA